MIGVAQWTRQIFLPPLEEEFVGWAKRGARAHQYQRSKIDEILSSC